MARRYSTYELEAFLDEALPSECMAEIEGQLRDSSTLQEDIKSIAGRRDAGVHSLGAIWRRHRLTCPTREQLGSYLLGVLDPEHAEYIRFHLEVIGCRYCNASLEDLRQQLQSADAKVVESRRKKYFQSSAGYLC